MITAAQPRSRLDSIESMMEEGEDGAWRSNNTLDDT